MGLGQGDAFKPLEDADLTVALRVLKPGGEVRSNIEGDLCMISVYGSDKPGIVYRVANVLGDKKVNITDLNTKLVGTEERPVYVMVIEATLPEGVEEGDVDNWLAPIRDELKVSQKRRSTTGWQRFAMNCRSTSAYASSRPWNSDHGCAYHQGLSRPGFKAGR